jgi:pyruvate formate lyase activating enzyme
VAGYIFISHSSQDDPFVAEQGRRPMTLGTIFDIKKFSIHDGPGIRTTVFFKGCPLSCWWCHNPESQARGRELVWRETRCIVCGACQAACPEGAISANGDGSMHTDPARCTLCGDCLDACTSEAREIVGRSMSLNQVMAEIERDVPFYDESGGGVTFSGGEPLLQAEFLRALLRACRERDIHTTLDTCGYARWETLDSLRADVDLFLYDLKLMDAERHRQVTGVSNQIILSNLEALARHGHALVLRLPLIPGLNDDEDNLRRTAAFAAGLPGVERLDILPYHPTGADKYPRLHKAYRLAELRPPSDERLAEITHIMQAYGLPVKIGG